jgi:hypothetical protein
MSNWESAEQLEAMLVWLHSEPGRLSARRLVRKYGLTEDADDLVSMVIEKLSASLARRDMPIHGIANEDQAVRYAYRAMANQAIDLARRRRSESVALVNVARLAPSLPTTENTATSQVFIEELFVSLHRVVSEGFACPSCREQVTYAAATEVLHLALLEGSDAALGQSWLDDVIYGVVDRYETGMNKSAAARRQRRSRCRRCVMELLQAALEAIGVRRG